MPHGITTLLSYTFLFLSFVEQETRQQLSPVALGTCRLEEWKNNQSHVLCSSIFLLLSSVHSMEFPYLAWETSFVNFILVFFLPVTLSFLSPCSFCPSPCSAWKSSYAPPCWQCHPAAPCFLFAQTVLALRKASLFSNTVIRNKEKYIKIVWVYILVILRED